MRMIKSFIIAVSFFIAAVGLHAQEKDFLFQKGFPASSGMVEKNVAGTEDIVFFYRTPYYQITYDMNAIFPREKIVPCTVEKVFVNGVEKTSFNVLNNNIFSRLRKANGNDDCRIYVEGNWEWGKNYAVRIEGKDEKNSPVTFTVSAAAPDERNYRFVTQSANNTGKSVDLLLADLNIKPGAIRTVLYNTIPFQGFRIQNENNSEVLRIPFNWSANTPYHFTIVLTDNTTRTVRSLAPMTEPTFGYPSTAFPFYNIRCSFGARSFPRFEITDAFVDEKEVRDFLFNDDGENARDKVVTGENNLDITVHCDWSPHTAYAVKVLGKTADGTKVELSQKGVSPASGGYWNNDWKNYLGVILTESNGIKRTGDPVHLNVGLFKDQIINPENEIRVVEINPSHKIFSGTSEGYPCVETPSQVYHISTFDDPDYINKVEYDSAAKREIHRYDATTCFEVAFRADLESYEKKLYLIFYNNPSAKRPVYGTDLMVTGEGVGKTVENPFYKIKLDKNSGAFEQIFVKQGLDIMLEHKLETNGAVHWNPDVYAPPLPWVHASDWQKPEFEEISGPVFYMSRRFAPLPHMTSVKASVTYFFYPDKPFIIVMSTMELEKDLDVQAVRNAEIVFNHAVLNEFVYKNRRGEVQSLKIEGSRLHPEHAIEISDKVPWLGFVNRERKIGFVGINLEYLNNNKYGGTPSTFEPYFYVANGPWIYMSRGLNYSFGSNNPTRMLKAKAGSVFTDKIAYVPFKLNETQREEFAIVEDEENALRHPIDVQIRMETDRRNSKQWIAPLLTAPFDEGVKGAVGTKKTGESKKGKLKIKD